jgi:predicted anti-sigma-YlaC factor YlaD
MLERALAIDPDAQPRDRLATLVSQRKARWLLDRVDDLILTAATETSGGSP